ncbi:polycomb complex protein BMI-1-A-like [Acropora muricata]|uniref:polycomb complex protein BMI-1-A-like n=1 Tax=Acropora muricata TaxID=159855 RepID=UPI0034E3BD93
MSLRTMQLNDLNPHILCVLCGGYLVDATTIVECLHSFCRSCIVKYLQTSYNCPVCDVEVHKTKPLLHIRPDRTLQDIVFKIVPGIYHEEVNRRKEFDANQQEECEQAPGDSASTGHKDKKGKEILPFDDPVCITLEYFRKTRNRMEKEIFPTRYLRCSSLVTVSVLKKFVITKFAIPETHITEIIRSDEILDENLTMKEVCRIYGLYSKPFVDLQYVFLEKNETATPVEKPKIVEVKRKRIKKRKEGGNLLKKCPSANAYCQHGNEDNKGSKLPSSQKSESDRDAETAPVQARLFEKVRKENLVPSDLDRCVTKNRDDLVSTQMPSLTEHIGSVFEENDFSSCTNMSLEATLATSNSVANKIESSLITTPTVHSFKHARSSNADNASNVLNHAKDMCLNPISGEFEASGIHPGLLVETS